MNLNIYFCGSIRGGREDAALYLKIVNHLKKNYGRVLTEIVADPNVLEKEGGGRAQSQAIYNEDMEWLKLSDVIVAEVTQVSTGVGYELGMATALGKPVLALFRPSSGKILSCMVDGAHNGTTFIVKNYEEKDAFLIIDNYFSTFNKD